MQPKPPRKTFPPHVIQAFTSWGAAAGVIHASNSLVLAWFALKTSVIPTNLIVIGIGLIGVLVGWSLWRRFSVEASHRLTVFPIAVAVFGAALWGFAGYWLTMAAFNVYILIFRSPLR